MKTKIVLLFSGSAPAGGIEGNIAHAGTIYLCRDFFEWPKLIRRRHTGGHVFRMAL